MIYQISLSPNAEADLQEAALWYESKQIGLGIQFKKKLNLIFSKFKITHCTFL